MAVSSLSFFFFINHVTVVCLSMSLFKFLYWAELGQSIYHQTPVVITHCYTYNGKNRRKFSRNRPYGY